MPRQQGLRPIGDSVRKIIERIRKEREERRNKNKPIRTQPKLPGMKKGGISKSKKAAELKRQLGGTLIHRPPKPKMRVPEKQGMKKGGETDLGKIFDEKFYKSALGKEAQLHADSYDAGLDRAEKRAASETMRMKKKKKMGGGMLKYNKGGGADSGTKGETRSKVYSYARKIKDKDRLTQRDIEKAEKMAYKKKLMKGFKKGGFPDLSGDGKTTMKDILIGRGVIKKKKGGVLDKNVRVIDLMKQGKTSKKGIRVKGKGKSFMDVYKKTVYNRAEGGMVPFGGEKRVPGSGAATRGTGFKGIF